mgnify:FL=1|tara:strand:+ start:1556 stop:2107 length:552 start_codon:yes stop_codon:yes gene_type:complete
MRNQHPRNYDKKNNHNFKVNNDIRMREIRLIDTDGAQLGIKDPRDAVEIAKEKELDLVMISEQANPPVCKIVDLNKYIYAEKKKQKEKDKKARESRIEIKEIQLRPVTQKHDLETKAKQIQKFIDKGNNVKIVLRFRGREQGHIKAGFKIFKEVEELLKGVEYLTEPQRTGPRIIGIIKKTNI